MNKFPLWSKIIIAIVAVLIAGGGTYTFHKHQESVKTAFITKHHNHHVSNENSKITNNNISAKYRLKMMAIKVYRIWNSILALDLQQLKADGVL